LETKLLFIPVPLTFSDSFKLRPEPLFDCGPHCGWCHCPNNSRDNLFQIKMREMHIVRDAGAKFAKKTN